MGRNTQGVRVINLDEGDTRRRGGEGRRARSRREDECERRADEGSEPENRLATRRRTGALSGAYNQPWSGRRGSASTQLARELLDALARSQSVILLKDREVVRQAIAHALADELRREEEREESVRTPHRRDAQAPRAGTREWEELFRKLVEEEYLREGLDS